MSYEWWQKALSGVPVGGPDLPVHEDQAQPGFFRKRLSRGGPFTGVAIFPGEGGELVAMIGRNPPAVVDPLELWTWCCRYPVTEAFYRTWETTGKWPDEDSGVMESLEAPEADMSPGANNPPKDEVTVLQEQIDAASKNADAYKVINDDETAAKAQSVRSRLLELGGDADKKREAEKRPHLDANKVIDKKWQPLVRKAQEAADTIRAALRAHEKRKDEAEQERQRLAAEAARKAELAAKRAMKKGEPLPPPPPPPPEPAPVQTTIRGGYGRAASIRMVKVVTIIDQDAAYTFLKSDAALVELIQKLAKRAVDAGFTVPGTKVTEEKDVR